MPSVFTIEPPLSFLDELARGILDRHGGPEGERLSDALVLLPTRRAVRALSEAFLRLAEARGRRAVILPRIRAIGDVDEEELLLDAIARLGAEAGSVAAIDIPPAISSLRRELLLAKLVRRWRARTGPERRIETPEGTSPARALALARDLARLLDLAHTEGVSLDGLAGVVPEHLAHHWQETLAFLEILSVAWPAMLAEEGAVDPSVRRDLLLRALADAWRARPPAYPVVAAGSTGSVPATAELLAVVACLPQGAVVLPGLDLALDRQSFEAVGPGHPQAAMKRLLQRLDCPRAEVGAWTSTAAGPAAAARMRLVNEALRPVDTSDAWRDIGAGIDLKAACEGLALVEADTPADEALTIAILLREALLEPRRTAALVTPDRDLARRVVAELARFAVAVDDSGGLRLARTPAATFLRLIAEATPGLAPVPLLSLLRHPLCTAGLTRTALSRAASQLEIHVLRGLRPGLGFKGLRHALAARDGLGSSERTAIVDLLDRLEDALRPLLERLAGPAGCASALLAEHVRAAERLAATVDEGTLVSGAERIWHGEEGERLAEAVSQALAEIDVLGPLPPKDYPELLDAILEPLVLRPQGRAHPRLHIWGPLEARLQHADLLVLGGLNEGTWPATAELDPWLNRPMRAALGLSMPEERLGLAAHDFCELASAPNVVLTRALKAEGAKTVASRWLLRLRNLLKGVDAEHLILDKLPHGAWARSFDASPTGGRPAKPKPKPPLDARPRTFSVTEVGLLTRDPYAIYAKRVLRLRPLDPLDADPGKAELGMLVHDGLAAFAHAWPEALPADAEMRLLALMSERLAAGAFDDPAAQAIWWPRIREMVRFLLREEKVLRAGQKVVAVEVDGGLEIDAPAGAVTLTARADRIDLRHEGGYALYDYKTGRAATEREARAGFSSQLPLEAAMLARGAFEGLPAGPVVELAHIALSGFGDGGERKALPAKHAIEDTAEHCLRGFSALLAHYDDPSTPYLSRIAPKTLRTASDYDHLARAREWRGDGEGEE